MAYLVLARKYRPQRFEDVVKQDHITKALSNALTSGRLAHAILLSGPRGTGKTTIARILAKCVNCESGPTATPCNTCSSCLEITSGHAADVFEIDGASNNKVDNIREIRENAHYMPAHSPYKIYIIDEVHMLSDSAFNALLKILEEPPSHVKFFFATTEPNKIPITILSRCQRHDCRRVDIDAIIDHMAHLCQQEAIDISREALTIIGREADGSIRDALSLLDLVITSVSGPIGMEQIMDVLGGLDRQSLFEMSQAVFDRDAGKVIDIIDRLYDRGQHMVKLFSEFIEHFRNLLVVKLGGGPRILTNVPEFEQQAMHEQIREIPKIRINQILDQLFKEETSVRFSAQPRLAMEMAFFRILQMPPAVSIDTLIEKMDAFRKGFSEASAHVNSPGTVQKEYSGESELQKSAFNSAPAIPAIPTNISPGASPSSQPDIPVSKISEKDQPGYSTPGSEKKTSPGEEKEPDAVKESGPQKPFSSTPETDSATADPDEPAALSWKNILAVMALEQPSLKSCFSESTARKPAPDALDIAFTATQFNINFAQKPGNLDLLQSICNRYFGKEIKISFSPRLLETNTSRMKKKEARLLETEALSHPVVEEAMKLFNGKIVEIKLLQEA
ncbi:MAG: DNA polymerase III subunit gamma/tau [Desulfobacteraceae bacterium]|nr:MAG: DNA polymerase III subunit gamma/tau [Desulfobacteraceae bacterium]